MIYFIVITIVTVVVYNYYATYQLSQNQDVLLKSLNDFFDKNAERDANITAIIEKLDQYQPITIYALGVDFQFDVYDKRTILNLEDDDVLRINRVMIDGYALWGAVGRNPYYRFENNRLILNTPILPDSKVIIDYIKKSPLPKSSSNG